MSRLLLAENDDEIRVPLVRALEREGHDDVEAFAVGSADDRGRRRAPEPRPRARRCRRRARLRRQPPHVHSDEEEIFFVTAGAGLLWQDGATYAVALGDTIVHLDEIEAEHVVRGGYDLVDRDAGSACGSHRAGLRHVTLAPGTLSCPPHWHSAEEELFHVLDGDGEAVLGEEDPAA